MRTGSEPRRTRACAAIALVAPFLWLCATGAVAGDLVARIRADGAAVANAVVAAMPVDHRVPGARSSGREVIDQIDHEFVPYVKAVFVGSAVYFPNRDNVRHQVYSFSPAKKFELPLYAGTPAEPVVFDKAGVVVLGCNIHDWMIGYVYVSDTPYFAVSGEDGTARIAALPAGEYEVRVWHPSMNDSEAATMRRVSVAAGRVEQGWDLKLRPEFRRRKVPIGGGGRKY